MQPVQPQPDPERKRFMNNAVGVAAWVWVVVTLIPVAIIAACCFGCFGASILGSATTPIYNN